MTGEAPFRVALIIGFVAVLLVTLWYRIRSWSSREKLDRRPEGWFILLTLRPFGLVLWTLHSLGRNLTDTVVTRRDHTLVTGGPYRWVRHPFYASFAFVILACALLAANWLFLLLGGVVLGLIALRTGVEEQRLSDRFGEAYDSYRRRTGRLVPRWPLA